MASPESPVPAYLLPLTARIDAQGRLSVGDLDVESLADEFGTPLFIYDEAHLRDRCRSAVSAWGDGVAYGTKAFLCRAMARLAHEEGMRLDVSTGGEMHVSLAAGVPAEKLVLHGNNKSVDELTRALDARVGRIVIDSLDEIERLAKLLSGRSRAGERPQPVMIRLTPGVEAHTHEFVMTGQEDSKFGFGIASGAADRALEMIERVNGLRLVGVHAHIGSQIFRAESFAEEVEVLADFFKPLGLEELCVGGGLGVPYVTGESAPSISDWANTVHEACDRAGIPESTRVTAEPGRAIVASAALTVYRVGTVKVLPGVRTYVSVDGGMSDNPRPVLYGSGYEAFIPRLAGSARTQPVTVVGKHCESGDVLVGDALLPEGFEEGDVLATAVTGAYGYSMASNYNKVPRPAVVFVSDGRARIVVRRETEEDLLRLDE